MRLTLKKKSLRYKLLRMPIYRTFSQGKADNSRFQYRDQGFGKYTLSPLGILHELIGLTVEVKE